MIPVLAGLAGLAMLCNPGRRRKSPRVAKTEKIYVIRGKIGPEYSWEDVDWRYGLKEARQLLTAYKKGACGSYRLIPMRVTINPGKRKKRRRRNPSADARAYKKSGPQYAKYFALGVKSAKGGNAWLSSSPFKGSRGEAWKDGMWSVIHPFHKNPLRRGKSRAVAEERRHTRMGKIPTGTRAECTWLPPGYEEPSFDMPWLDRKSERKNPPDISIRWVKIHDPKHKGWVAECYQPGGIPIQRFWGRTKAECLKKINDKAEGK
jgi:hypothetical protein